MQQVVPIEEFKPIISVKNGHVFTNSRNVAEAFDKQHAHVLRDIDNLLEAGGEDASRFGDMFQPADVADAYGRSQRAYHMTRDGFTLLAMGFTGPKALIDRRGSDHPYEILSTLARLERLAFMVISPYIAVDAATPAQSQTPVLNGPVAQRSA